MSKIKHNTRQNAKCLKNQIELTHQVAQLTLWQSNHASESQQITSFGADECLTFALVEQDDGVELKVIGWKTLLPQPGEPDYIKGIISLRGDDIPVLDLKILACPSHTEMTQDTCIVLFENPEPYKHYFGIVARGLSNVFTIAHKYRKEGEVVQHLSENPPGSRFQTVVKL